VLEFSAQGVDIHSGHTRVPSVEIIGRALCCVEASVSLNIVAGP
jgi:hypothetical protein